MPSNITVSIPMKPHLIKYLIELSINKCQPVVFPAKSEFNYLLLKFVSIYDSSEVRSYKIDNSKTAVEIVLPYSDKKNVASYNYIGAKKIKRFRYEVSEDFKFRLKLYIKQEMIKGINRKEAILNFMEMYNINEDDIKFSTLYRYSSRFLQKKLKNVY